MHQPHSTSLSDGAGVFGFIGLKIGIQVYITGEASCDEHKQNYTNTMSRTQAPIRIVIRTLFDLVQRTIDLMICETSNFKVQKMGDSAKPPPVRVCKIQQASHCPDAEIWRWIKSCVSRGQQLVNGVCFKPRKQPRALSSGPASSAHSARLG